MTISKLIFSDISSFSSNDELEKLLKLYSYKALYIDSLSSYDKLDVSGFIHHRINHSKAFVDRQTHINGIEREFLESGQARTT